MSDHPADFRVEIIQVRPRGITTFPSGIDTFALEASDPAFHPPAPIDITGMVLRDGFGGINRALERDLLSFKTGDLTFSVRNADGFFDDLFAFFGATDMWSVRVFRRGAIQFWGCLIGKGSITFDRKVKTVEMTAYGLTKILDSTSAETVRRILSTYELSGLHIAGSTTLTLALLAADFQTGDTVHLTDQVNKEDVTVRQATSSTTVLLEAGTTSQYASGTPVTIETPYHRFKSISYLATALFGAAGISVSDLRISPSQFNTLGPTPVNLGGLATIVSGNPIYTCPAEKSSSRYETHLVDGTYYQTAPDSAWVLDDSTVRAYVDWSRYYTQTETEPTTVLRDPDAAESTAGGDITDPHYCAYDYKAASPVKYNVDHTTGRIRQRTFAAGVWGARANVDTAPAFNSGLTDNDVGVEIDIGRQQLYMWTTEGASPQAYLYDLAGATFTSIRQADDTATTRYGGFVCVPELDMVLALRSESAIAGASAAASCDIVAFRNGARLWKRSFPTFLLQRISTTGNMYIFPTHSLRCVDGNLYCVVVSDGKAQMVYSTDQFVTYQMKALTDPGVGPRIFASRVNDAYQIACYDSSTATALQRGLFIAAPFYAGVVEYADFAGVSCADALKKLSILANALFWVDDDLQGHFVARDLYDSGAVFDITDRVKSRTDDLLWDEIAQYVTVSGGGFEATAGDAGFATEGIDLQSDFIPTEAFAQALADAVFAFYSAERQMLQVVVHDRDGHIYRPLDRVSIDGIRYLVYESDHSLMDDEVTMTLLEDR